MLAKNSDKEILKSKDYIFEPKIDGYRALCIKKDTKKLEFISRNGKSITDDFPEFNFLKNINAKKCILDGEIMIFDAQGNPSFELMQNRSRNQGKAVYVVFDILEKDGKDLRDLPIEKRKEILANTIIENEHLQIIPFTDNGTELWKKIHKRNLEGVMAKRKASSYIGQRSSQWLKIKEVNTIDCVIIGIIQKKREISSLALGLYDENNHLRFIGKVGTGFSEHLLNELNGLLKRTKNLKVKLYGDLPKNLIPVVPNKVCEIKFLRVTKDFKLRMPVFIRLRPDKLPEECLFKQLNFEVAEPKLKKYKEKRNFEETPEPAPKLESKVETQEPIKIKKTRPLIYVIQKHYARALHYDFRLEYKGVLISWAVPKGMPGYHEKRLGIMTEDHPLSYADFEGTIPKGNYGAGKVEIWDKGKYVNITIKNDKQVNLRDAIKKGHFTIYLKGKKLDGTFSFTKMKDDNWLIVKKEEKIEESKVVFTHLDKKLDTGITKKDLIDYYEKVWNLMLPQIEDRAITLYRFPSGIKGEKFFQKNSPDYYPEYIECKEVEHKDKKKVCYPIVKDRDGILYLANQVGEIHVMPSKVDKMEYPDKMVFDLDPSNLDIKLLKAVAKKLKVLIESLGLTAFIMTTGGKGYHIVAPIKPEFDNTKVRDIALKIAEVLVESDPDHLTTELLKSKRKGKIFIDINRNSPMQTSIAPYSVRAKKGLTIAVPFFWKELSKVDPDSYNIKNYKVEDPWKDFYESAVSLKKMLKKLK